MFDSFSITRLGDPMIDCWQ